MYNIPHRFDRMSAGQTGHFHGTNRTRPPWLWSRSGGVPSKFSCLLFFLFPDKGLSAGSTKIAQATGLTETTGVQRTTTTIGLEIPDLLVMRELMTHGFCMLLHCLNILCRLQVFMRQSCVRLVSTSWHGNSTVDSCD